MWELSTDSSSWMLCSHTDIHIQDQDYICLLLFILCCVWTCVVIVGKVTEGEEAWLEDAAHPTLAVTS